MSEHQHFTREQVSQALYEANAIVEELDLPAEIEGQAILWAAQKLAEKTIMQAAPALLPNLGRIQ
jgi:hypothetical protein